MKTIKWLAKLLYWKLAIPGWISLWPYPKVCIASGPFCGMRYVPMAQGSSHSAKILGTYEKELHARIADAMAIPFKNIVNIGAGEGYYAVGLAKGMLPERTVAFEIDEAGRSLMRQLAEWNSVSNVEIHGRCEADDLRAALASTGPTLVICDIEGYEEELLDPHESPGLSKAWVLVELHDSIRAGVSALIADRFRATHEIEEIPSRQRTWSDFPGAHSLAALLPRSVGLRAMNESRDRQSWFWMTPKA